MAAAQEASSPAIEQHAQPGLVIGVKAGLGSGKPIGDFGLQYGFELDVGYLLPLPAPLRHSVELFVSTGYVRSGLTGQSAQRDARLPGNGLVSYSIREQSLPWGGGVRWRVPLHSQRFAPYFALGYRAFSTIDVIHTRVAGRAVPSNTERSLTHGFFVSAGLELFIGPGAVLGEAQLTRAARDELVLTDAVGGIQAFVGYRLMFGEPVPKAAKVVPVTKPEPPAPAPLSAEPVTPPIAASAPELAAQEAPTVVLSDAARDSQIRGVVRSFAGSPVHAHVSVEPGALATETAGDGRFSISVAPGHYTVTLRADGYATQTKTCEVDDAGITVLNVELRDE
jgi:hypothetical protein